MGKGVIMASKKAERAQLYLRCALFGPSSGDKTMTAVRMVKEIAEKTGVPITIIDIEKPGEKLGVALYEWLTGDTAPISKTAAEIPAKTSKEKQADKPSSFTETGNVIIEEIKNILTSTTPKGDKNFSEEEKEEARSIIKTAPMNESGIQTLSDLRELLSEEHEKREAAFLKAA
jgi:hypothetical protein